MQTQMGFAGFPTYMKHWNLVPFQFSHKGKFVWQHLWVLQHCMLKKYALTLFHFWCRRNIWQRISKKCDTSETTFQYLYWMDDTGSCFNCENPSYSLLQISVTQWQTVGNLNLQFFICMLHLTTATAAYWVLAQINVSTYTVYNCTYCSQLKTYISFVRVLFQDA